MKEDFVENLDLEDKDNNGEFFLDSPTFIEPFPEPLREVLTLLKKSKINITEEEE